MPYRWTGHSAVTKCHIMPVVPNLLSAQAIPLSENVGSCIEKEPLIDFVPCQQTLGLRCGTQTQRQIFKDQRQRIPNRWDIWGVPNGGPACWTVGHSRIIFYRGFVGRWSIPLQRMYLFNYRCCPRFLARVAHKDSQRYLRKLIGSNYIQSISGTEIPLISKRSLPSSRLFFPKNFSFAVRQYFIRRFWTLQIFKGALPVGPNHRRHWITKSCTSKLAAHWQQECRLIDLELHCFCHDANRVERTLSLKRP